MMNIAIILPNLMGGGAQHAAKDIGSYYHQQGNTVYYFVGDDEKARYDVPGKVIRTNVRLWRINEGTERDRNADLIYAAGKIRRLKKQYNIDYSLSFMEECNYINILSRYHDTVIIRVCTILSARKELEKEFFYDKKRIHDMYSKADRIVVMSTDGKNELVQHYSLPKKRISVIPNIISSCVSEPGCNTQSKILIAINRLDPVKQYGRMIRAFSYAQKQDSEIKLLILGEGDDRELVSLCRELKIQNSVIFEGHRTNIGDYLKNSRGFIITSECEGFSYSSIEAMSYGVPVICSDFPGGLRDIIECGDIHPADSYEICKNGIITPRFSGDNVSPSVPVTKEEKILGEAILELFRNDTLYRELSDAAFKRAKDYHYDIVMAKWDEIFTVKGRESHPFLELQSLLYCLKGVFTNKQAEKRHKLILEANRSRKYAEIYRRWVEKRQDNDNFISETLKDNGYKTVAVYGLGHVGKNLIRELSGSDVEVKYGIDRKAGEIDAAIPVFSLDDDLENVDVIIVTVPDHFIDIREDIKRKIDVEVKSIETLILG